MPNDEQGNRAAIVVGVLLSISALAGAVTHIAFPDLKIDTIVIALLALAAIPWLGSIFESVDLPGGLKVKYRELRKEMQDLKFTQSRTEDRVDTVEEELRDTGGTFAKSETSAHAADTALTSELPEEKLDTALSSELPDEQLNALIHQYNEIRATQPSGFARTTAMTKVIQDMIRLADKLQGFDWRKSLESSDRGVRLAAYGFLWGRPTPDAAIPLVRTLTRLEDKPFGQYWALKTLDKVLTESDTQTVRMLEPTLTAFRSTLRPGTDRYQELTRLLDKIAGRTDGPSSRP